MMHHRFLDVACWPVGGMCAPTPRTLSPHVPQASSVDPSSCMARYQAVVHTSSMQGAGTSARVHLTLNGALGSSKQMALQRAGPGSFQAGAVDRCEVSCRDVGELRSIRIGHDNSGAWQPARGLGARRARHAVQAKP